MVEQTWTAPGQGGADSVWGDLYGTVDIWCPLFSLHEQESAARRQALGERIWTYTALCQGKPTPWWHIDYPLLHYRVPTWIAWRYRMWTALLGRAVLLGTGGRSLVEAPYLRTGSGAPQQGRKGVVFYGEGSLVYPGRGRGLRRRCANDSTESAARCNRGLRLPGPRRARRTGCRGGRDRGAVGQYSSSGTRAPQRMKRRAALLAKLIITAVIGAFSHDRGLGAPEHRQRSQPSAFPELQHQRIHVVLPP